MVLSLTGIATAGLQDSLLGYWKLDGNTDDASINGNNGSLNGDPGWVAGLDGQAIDLDGDGDWVTVPGATEIPLANSDFSLSFWLKRGNTNEGWVIGDADGGGNQALHIGFRSATSFAFAFWGDDFGYDNAMYNNTTDWMHFVLTYNAATNLQSIYANVVGGGTDFRTDTRGNDFSGTGNFYMGTRKGAGGPQFNGLMDEVGVWDRVLSAGEAGDLYNAGTPLDFFNLASETLVWDGDHDGNWADLTDPVNHVGLSHWTGGATGTSIPFYTDETTGSEVIINTGHATVATAAQAAHSVDVGAGGQLSVVGGDLTVMHGLNSSSTAALTVGGGGMLTADRGTITAVSIGGGSGTISTAGNISATDLTILDSSSLIKTGAGKLSFSGIGAISATGTSIRVTGGGELDIVGTPGVATVELDGGTLSIDGPDALNRTSLTYDFESGDLSGWTIIPTAHGDNALFQGGKQPYSGQGGTQGTWAIVSYRNQNGGVADGYTGIIETDSFVIGEAGTITFQIAAGNHALGGDPDSPNANMAGVALEREVTPGNWEMLQTATHANNWTWANKSWDTTPYIGDTVRMRIYDTHPGSWGHTAVDNIQISSADVPVVGAIAMGGTDFVVTQNSTLNAATDYTATFGGLTLTNGTLDIRGVTGGTTFASLAAVSASASVGITSTSDVAINSAVTLGDGASLTLTGETYTVGDVTMSGSSGSIALASTLEGGELTLPAGTFGLSGTQNYTGLTTTGTPVTIDFGAGGTITTGTFDDENSGAPRALNLTGSGTLKFNGGAVSAADTTFSIASGTTLSAAHAAGDPMGAGGTSIKLNGGTFQTGGGVTSNYTNGFRGSIFTGIPRNDVVMNLDGAAYAYDANRILTGSKANTVLARAEVGGQNVTWDGKLQSNGSDFQMFPGYGEPDDFAWAFSGTFIPALSGQYNFRWNVDDRGLMYLDVDGNGIFEAADKVGSYAWSGAGNTGSLTAGEEYSYIWMGQDFAGGQPFNVWMTPPGGSEAIVDSTVQTGQWVHGPPPSVTAISMTTTDFEVTANSSIVANTTLTADFGELTLTSGIVDVSGADGGVTFSSIGGSIAAGAVTGITSDDPVTLTGTLDIGDRADVTLGGAPLTITGGITLNDDGGNGIEEATIRVPSGGTVAWPGAFDQTGVNTRLTKAGPGTLQMRTLGATTANLTTFIARDDGTLEFDGGSVGGSTQLNLDGATIRITGAGSPAPAGAIANWKFDETSGTTAADSSGNGHDGSISGALIGQAARPGSTGTSYYFSGNADIVTVAAGEIDLSNKSFSLAAWTKRDAPNGDYLFGQGTAEGNNALHVGFRDANNATFAFYGNDSDHVDNPQYEDTVGWHQLVVTYNVSDGMRHIYWDGVDQTPLTNNPTGTPYQGSGAFRIGTRWDGNSNFQGWLDDLYVYDSVLSEVQVGELFAASPVIDAINLPGTTIAVSADSTLDAVTTTTATFGPLRLMEPSVLTTSGADGGVIFSDTLMAMDAEYGFDTAVDTSPGPIAAGTVTIVKTGAADLILDPGDPAGSLTFDVRQGAVVGQAGSNPFGDNNAIGINGGEVVLVAKDAATDPTFDNPVTSTINGGTLTAGRDGDGFARTATIGSATNHVTLDADGTLLMQTLDGYTLNVGGNVTGAGHMTIGAGSTVTVAGTLDAGTVIIDGGLTVAGTVNVNELIANPGGSYTGPSNLTVAQTLTLNGDLDLSAAALVIDGANVTVNNGTLTVGATNPLGVGAPVGSVDLSNGGGLALAGTSLTTKKLTTTGGTFDMGAGSLVATGDVAIDPAPGLGPVQLKLTGGTLRLNGPGGAMPGGLRLHLDASDASTVFEDTGGTNPAENGTSVARWNDLSGNGFDVTHNNAGQLPQYDDTGNTLNGLATLHFDGDKIGRANDIGITGNADRTVITVWHNATGTGQNFQHTFHMGTGGPPSAYGHSVSRGDNAGRIGNHFWGEGFNSTATGGLTQANIAISTWDGDGGAGANGLDSWYVNGIAEGTYERGALTTAGNELLIGSRLVGPTEGIRGNIAEVLVFDSVLTAEEINDIGGHLAGKWGIGAPAWNGSLAGEMNLPGTNLLMTSETTINVSSDASLGDLHVAYAPVTLTFTGPANNSINLASTTFAAPPELTIDNTPKVNLGPLDLAGSDWPLIEKINTGQWIVTDEIGGYTNGLTIEIAGGALVLGDPGLIGTLASGSELYMGEGTTLKLSSSSGDKQYDEFVDFTGDTTIVAGRADGSSAAAATITRPALHDMSSQNVTLGTTDDTYTLKINSAVAAGTLGLTGGGTVTLDNGGSAATSLSVPSGTLNVNNAPFAAPSISVTQNGSLNLGVAQSTGDLLVNTTGTVNVPNPLTVTNKITLGEVEIHDNANLEIVGANLGDPTGVLTLSGTAATIGFPPALPTNGLLGMWTFDESNGNDTSGNNYHGTEYGPVAYVARGSGMALDLTGGDAAVFVDTGGNQDVFSGYNAMTIAVWAKGTPGGWSPFVSKDEDGWQMRRHSGETRLDWTTRGLTSSDWNVPNSGPAINGLWHFIVMTYDGSQKKTYIYGEDLGSPIIESTGATGTITNTQDTLVFGARDNNNNAATIGWQNFLNGQLDDIYFYDRAINQTEVEVLYAGGGISGVIDMPNMDIVLNPGVPTVTLNAESATLGSLTMGTNADLTLIHADTASFNDVRLADAATTINQAPADAIGLTVRGTLQTGDTGNLTRNLTVNGDLTVANMNAVGATVAANNFTATGDVSFDGTSGLMMPPASTLSVPDGGTTTFSDGSFTTGVDAIEVAGTMVVETSNVSTRTLTIAQDATLNASSPVAVSHQAIIGDDTVAEIAGPAFGVSGGDVVSTRILTLNGGTMTLAGPTTGGAIVMPGGLLLHLDASEVTGVNNGDPVVQWDDQSPNANHGTQTNAAYRATYVASDAAINNKPALSFDGDNDQYQYINLAARTVFFVAKADAKSANLDGILGKAGADDGIRRSGDGAWAHPGDGNDFTNPGGSTFYINGAPTGAVGENVWHIAEAVRGGGAMNFDKVGQYFAARDFPGDIAEVLIFGGVLSEDDRQNIGGYLELKYGFDTPYTGSLDAAPLTTDLSNTTLAAAASSTVTIAGSTVTIGGVEAADSATLTIAGPAATIALTNLTLGGDSMVKSTAAAGATVDITVSEKLSTGGGNSNVGDPGDEFGVGADTYLTNLALIDGAVPADADVEWTLTSIALSDLDGDLVDDTAIGDSLHVYGTLNMAAGLTIQLVDGLAPGVNVSGVDIALFKVSDMAVIDGVAGPAWTSVDVAKITVLPPAGEGWTFGDLAYVNDEYVVLTNLVTGIHLGDANGDSKVDEEDLVLLNAQWGDRGAVGTLSCDFDGDGDVDVDDFQILNAEWGYDGTGGGAPVMPGSETPEPATVSLLAIGGLLILRRRRRKA
jgi:cytoskeletal protein CcmA (bactofilin family)